MELSGREVWTVSKHAREISVPCQMLPSGTFLWSFSGIEGLVHLSLCTIYLKVQRDGVDKSRSDGEKDAELGDRRLKICDLGTPKVS